MPILADVEDVKVPKAIETEDNATFTAFDNRHLYLRGKITDVEASSYAEMITISLFVTPMVRSSRECTSAARTTTLEPVVTVAIIAQWVIECWSALRDLSIQVLRRLSGRGGCSLRHRGKGDGNRRIAIVRIVPREREESNAARYDEENQCDEEDDHSARESRYILQSVTGWS